MVVTHRKILHLDMDCFYAAIEIRDRPELAGKPVAVGGSRDRRGVLTTCNYEAREFGVRSAMPTYMALQRCPGLIVVPTRFDVYRAESLRVREILRQFTETIEPLSLDEAYLDVTALPHDPAAIAAEIRGRINETTGLTASAGIAPNKLLAKIASDWRKPDGQFEIKPSTVSHFMLSLPVRKLWGIGEISARKLDRLGVQTCGQLQQFTRINLHQLFGKFGLELYELCRGIDERPVQPHRIRKSLSTERTFNLDLTTLSACEERLIQLHEELVEDLTARSTDRQIHKLFLKLKFADFSRTTAERLGTTPDLKAYQELLEEAHRRSSLGIRLMGIGVRFSDPVPVSPQLPLPLPNS